MKHMLFAGLAGLTLAAVTLVPSAGRAQIFDDFAPIFLPEWEPGERYEPAGAPIIGSVSSTAHDLSATSYEETWQWVVGDAHPDLYAVQAGAVPSSMVPSTVRVGAVEEHTAGQGCSSIPEPPQGETFAVYNARVGAVPTPQGTLVLDEAGVEHWYLAPTYVHPTSENSMAVIVRRDPYAVVVPSDSTYIRVEFK